MLITEVFSKIPQIKIPENIKNIDAKGITEDSRKVEPGFIFFALRGAVLDGTKFIEGAINKGAILIVTHEDYKAKAEVPVITHENPRMVLSRAAANLFSGQPEFIAAVTGTNGKTSVANFVRQIFAICGKKSASIGTIGVTDSENNKYEISGSMTTPDPVSLFKLIKKINDNGIKALALEASSHGLDQHRLEGLKIKAAGFTNFTRDHLDYHKTMENYFAAKARLFSEVLIEGGTAVINADIPEYEKLKEIALSRGAKIISFGFKGTEIKLNKITPDAGGQQIEFEIFGEKFSSKLSLFGDFQVSNILCAAGLAIAGGLNPKEVAESYSKIINVDGRMEKAAETKNGAIIFVDYAHTPDGLEKAISTLKANKKGKLHVLFGCGGNRDKGKRPEMGKIASKLADRVIITDDNPRNEKPEDIRKEIISGCTNKNYIEVSDRKIAIKTAIEMLEKDDILLIAGKGHEKTQIIGDKTIEFDDVKIAREFV